jgi:hypothetical protein
VNIQKLKRSLLARVRLRPIALSILPSGEARANDDAWLIAAVSAAGTVDLNNPSTGHIARLGSDHIHHFDTDPPSNTDGLCHGFLILTVQVFMRGPELWLEPIARFGGDGG